MPDGARQRSDGLVFDQVALLYDQVRPDYPAELYADLTELAGLRPGARLLEVGSGTGKATAAMAGQGYQIVCLEPGSSMIEVARARLTALRSTELAGIDLAGIDLAGIDLAGIDLAGIDLAGTVPGGCAHPGAMATSAEIVRTTFEAWEPHGARFDLVFAATSWHWVDPAIGYAKAAALLSPGGSLAIWSAMHGFPDGFDPFFTEIQDVYERLTGPTGLQWPPPRPEEVPDCADEIGASGCFGDVAVRRYLWKRDYTAPQYIALLSTFSDHLTMDPAVRNALYAEVRKRIDGRPGGTVTRHWLAILNVAMLAP